MVPGDTQDDDVLTDLDAREAAAQRDRDEAANQEKVLIDDLRWLMRHKQGRRIMRRLLGDCGIFSSSFSPDVAVMAFHEGKRSIGLPLIENLMRHIQQDYSTMIEEHRRDGGQR